MSQVLGLGRNLSREFETFPGVMITGGAMLMTQSGEQTPS